MSASADEVLKEIRRLYFSATPSTILQDFDRAIDLLKGLSTAEERERAAVYMEGLAELRKEFGAARGKPRPRRPGR